MLGFNFGFAKKINGIIRTGLISLIELVNGVPTDTIGLTVADYDNIGATWQAIFFTDPSTPIVFENYVALWAAVSVVESFNTENVMGVEGKGVAVYDVTTSREILNKALRWFGLSEIVPDVVNAATWTEEHVLDDYTAPINL